MDNSPVNPERVADDTARRLLERAATLDIDGPTLAQLRQSAVEAGISTSAFDAAVAEWRAEMARPVAIATPRRWAEQASRNGAALAIGWFAVAALAVAQRLVDAPWLVQKFTDPLGLAIGAVVAARLRARTATVLLGGLAVSQSAEFLMDVFSRAPAIHGFGAHLALMLAGVAGVALGRAMWGRRVDTGPGGGDARGAEQHARTGDRSESRPVGLTDAEADKRFMEALRLRRSSYVTRLQLS